MNLVTKSDLLQRLFSSLSTLCLGNARQRQRKLDVGKHRLVGDKIVALENKAYGMVSVAIPIGVLEILCGFAVDYKVTAGISVKTADDIEHGGLSATRCAEDRHELVFAEFQVNSAERVYDGIALAVLLAYIF